MRASLLVLLPLASRADDPCTGPSAELNQTDCETFQQKYDSWGGKNWVNCSQLRNNPCACSVGQRSEWGAKFITCRATGQGQTKSITELHLPLNNLTGPLGHGLGKGFPELKWLGLHNNALTGAIPGDIGLLNQCRAENRTHAV